MLLTHIHVHPLSRFRHLDSPVATMSTRLPPEIWASIVIQCDRATCYQLLFVCKTLHQEAERELYREIVYNKSDPHSDPPFIPPSFTSHRLDFLLNISQSKRLGAYVKRLGLTDPGNRLSDYVQTQEYDSPIHSAFRNMPNLKHLQLSPNDYNIILPLIDCPFKLHSFRLTLGTRGSLDPELKAKIITFIESQPDITEITLSEDDDGFHFPPSSLRKLKVIAAPESDCRHLIPGRSIQAVYPHALRLDHNIIPDAETIRSLSVLETSWLPCFTLSFKHLLLLELSLVKFFFPPSSQLHLTQLFIRAQFHLNIQRYSLLGDSNSPC